MSKISYILELTLADGSLDEFKAKAETFVGGSKDAEPGTLTYQWWLAEDGKRCILHEVFESSEALLTHLGNVGPTLPELLAIAPITRFEVLGSASDEARAAIADLGAKHFPLMAGFQR